MYSVQLFKSFLRPGALLDPLRSVVLVVFYLPSALVGLRWGFFFVWDSLLIGLRFGFGAWGRGLGASVRADVRACLASNGMVWYGRCL